ncbi:transcription factor iiic subunit delta n-term [Holotrichia oblita]|uniref:Transcription factor iiic subunit delta n-term n=1 Tax=Holotrichia oblita TaxID=644536 RepID=A0ACB9TWF5_HOLOL|nr:transcription factor iiic subunit delta n-term [Holotrichia oblita]
MSFSFKHIEDIELPCKVIGTHSEISKNGCISIPTCSALYIYEIQAAAENTSPSLVVKKFSVAPSNFMLALNLGIDINLFLNDLPQDTFYEGILSTELSPILNEGSPVEPKIMKTTWSPQIINDYSCILATLSNTGSVQIITKEIDITFYEEYVPICDISQMYTEMCFGAWQDYKDMNPLEQFNELKRRVHETFPTALLFVGNSRGEVNCLKLTNFDKEKIIITSSLRILSETDEISVTNINFFTHMNKSYLLLTKGSDIIILLFNEAGKTVSSYVYHAGNIDITSVDIIEDNKVLVVCLTGATMELIINEKNSKVNVKWRYLYVNINWYIRQALNFMCSLNRMLFFFLTGPCKTADSKDDKDVNKLVVFFDSTRNPFQVLLENPTKNLKDYWDCLEALRCQVVLDKELPANIQSIDIDYDNMSLYKLKLLLFISKSLEAIAEQTGNISFISKSTEDIQQIVTIKLSIKRIGHLLKLQECSSNLTEFQLHNIYVLNTFLKQIVVENWILKLELGNSD